MMIGPKFNTRLIDPVIWSMVIEMRMSILMPAFILVLRRASVRTEFFVLAAVALLGNAPFFRFAHAAPFFIVGIQVAKHRLRIVSWVLGLSFWWRLAFLLASLALYGGRMFTPEASTLVDYVIGVGACGLILCVLSFPPCNAIASGPIALFLGNSSYSFYLVHLPVLVFLTSWFLPITHSLLGCWVSGLCASLLISAAIRALVELPSQRLGKRVWPASTAWIRNMVGAA